MASLPESWFHNAAFDATRFSYSKGRRAVITALLHTHILAAVLSIAVFVLQGVLTVARPALARHKALRIGTHVIYTLLLVTAIALLVVYGWNPLDFGWILIKIKLLVVFILLGIVAFKPKFPAPARIAAWVGALLALLWAYWSAVSKAVVPFL